MMKPSGGGIEDGVKFDGEGKMPYRANEFAQGCYYHVFNRTLNGEVLFRNPGNYIYLTQLMRRYKQRYRVSIIAYCLMPNHYHFLLRQDAEQPLHEFMRVLFNGYVQAYNAWWGRRGPLFEGRFHHMLIDEDEYFLHLCRYIHLNPVRAGLVSKVEDWPFSNFLEWVNQEEDGLGEVGFLLDYFADPEEYRGFVQDYQMGREAEKGVQRYMLD
jgi:REP element-mobilizing transposase RayT